jgi:carboxypeptidase C (cathepsin A)
MIYIDQPVTAGFSHTELRNLTINDATGGLYPDLVGDGA